MIKDRLQFVRFLSCMFCLLGTVLLSRGTANAAELVNPFDFSQDSYVFLGGYGQSVPGWGKTEERVTTLELIPRCNHRIIDNMGSGWYRGFHSILLEVPLSLVLSPDESAMLGITFLGAYTFTADPIWQPYLFGGGGPVYNFADIPGMGADINGNYQFGIGLEYAWTENRKLLVESRYHHISNNGSEDPNDPLNAYKLLVGVTF
ncbi:acyloxyacyl hydrolase [Desulfobulbus sp. US1]|nr:acyloxyacyl hydrolase [Desulfobulbus sp. US4]MCW5208079.1 acyloxyacyl hydrolase [Desulfobulbus sp. US2]MCW5209803.1 acyloxyacyl hydrolase [Desulfobulbus sp. US1]WLE96439.1 MAG: acyloxyacyl hydrolase [Candidatus Electrothrix communis]